MGLLDSPLLLATCYLSLATCFCYNVLEVIVGRGAMGISHDIRPKKVYRYGEKPAHSIDIEDDDVKNSSSSIDTGHEHEELEDDFFDNQKQRKSKPLKTDVDKKSPVPKWLAMIFVLALFGMLAYQNYDLVLKYIGLLPKDKPETTEKTETYTSTSSTPTTETPATTTTPTVTAPVATTPTIDKTSITLSVLNGNGIKGSAEAVSQTLKTAGFNPTKVANAKTFSYTSTYIYYQTGKETEAGLVATALAGRTIVKQLSDAIAGNYNVLVVVGTN